jgi:hypothetical protein
MRNSSGKSAAKRSRVFWGVFGLATNAATIESGVALQNTPTAAPGGGEAQKIGARRGAQNRIRDQAR